MFQKHFFRTASFFIIMDSTVRMNLLKTNIHGVAKFKVKFMSVPPEIMTKIMVQGLGGKAGIGMGFLWREEE